MRVLLVSNKEAVLYLNNKEPFTIYDSKGQVLDMVDEFLAPVDQSNFNTLSDYNLALKNSLEDTVISEKQDDTELVLYYANLCM